MPPTSVDYVTLRKLLTVERLGSYAEACCGELDAAFALYEWNIEASAAALSLTAMVEVLLRNALDRQLVAWAARRGVDDWLRVVPLDRRGMEDLRRAGERSARGGRPVSHGRVVAELNFGFWRYLVSRRYLTSLWLPALVHAFPGAVGRPHEIQRLVESSVSQLLFLRNRAAHHEPIHRRDLQADLDRALVLVSTIHPVAARWVEERESVSVVLARKPCRGGVPNCSAIDS